MSGEPELTHAPGGEPPPEEPAATVEEPAAALPQEALEDIPAEERGKIGAIIELRKELKAVKPLAEKAAQLESELNQLRPYAEFVRANPQLLERQQPPAPAPIPPSQDPELVAYARELELYDGTGQPDVTRAASIRDRIRRDAAMTAAEMMRPVQEQSHETRAAANLQSVLSLQDAHGKPIAPATIHAVVAKLASGLAQTTANPKGELLRLLADPQVIAQVIVPNAYAAQSQSARPAPAPPGTPPLETEAAGGSHQVTMSEHSRRLMKDAGISEKTYQESAKRYQPGRSNVVE